MVAKMSPRVDQSQKEQISALLSQVNAWLSERQRPSQLEQLHRLLALRPAKAILELALEHELSDLVRIREERTNVSALENTKLHYLREAAIACKKGGLSQVPEAIESAIARQQEVANRASYQTAVASRAVTLLEIPLPLCRDCRGTGMVRRFNGIDTLPEPCEQCEEGIIDPLQWLIAVGGEIARRYSG